MIFFKESSNMSNSSILYIQLLFVFYRSKILFTGRINLFLTNRYQQSLLIWNTQATLFGQYADNTEKRKDTFNLRKQFLQEYFDKSQIKGSTFAKVKIYIIITKRPVNYSSKNYKHIKRKEKKKEQRND